jgi:glycosyltransferase involved in cell wall biosynthesis
MLEPARVIAASTTDVEITIVHDEEDAGALEVDMHGRLNRAHVVGVKDPECDVLVLQRPASRLLAEVIPYLQQRGVAVVCEYDDDFDTVHPKNPAFRAYEPSLNPESNKVWAKLCSQTADFVTVATPRLAKRYGVRGFFEVLPNYVPQSYLATNPRTMSGDPTIGWTGFSRTHAGDLGIVGESLANLLADNRARFHGIGDDGMFKGLGLGRLDGYRQTRSDWVSLDAYPYLLANVMDIGIVPLADTTFNASKSWLKGLEMAALGIPFVASPTQQYVKLSRLGAGDVVATTTTNTGAWTRALERYVDDAEYRQLRAEEGRIVTRGLTYEKNAEKWVNAWRLAQTVSQARGT